MEVDGAPLLEDASIRDFQRGTIGYVADAVEQSLLLPKDMADLRSMKRDLAMVSLFLYLLYYYIFVIIIIYFFLFIIIFC